MSTDDLPSLRQDLLDIPDNTKLHGGPLLQHPPKILLLYGSLRERSFSRLLAEEAARLLQTMGCETRFFTFFAKERREWHGTCMSFLSVA